MKFSPMRTIYRENGEVVSVVDADWMCCECGDVIEKFTWLLPEHVKPQAMFCRRCNKVTKHVMFKEDCTELPSDEDIYRAALMGLKESERKDAVL
jgi:hypothetical protein